VTNLRQTGDTKDEAQRFQAQQAPREQAQLDVLSVYYVVLAKIEAGLVDEARALVKAWKAGRL
jgi:hypothetical protein